MASGTSGIGISGTIGQDMVTVVMENGDNHLQGNPTLREMSGFLPLGVHIPPLSLLLPLRTRPTTLLHGDHYHLLNRLPVITILAHVGRHRITAHRDLRPRNGKVVQEKETVLITELDRGRMRHRRIAARLVLCRIAHVLVPVPDHAHLRLPTILNPILIPFPRHRLIHTLHHNHIGKDHRRPQ